MDQHTFDWYTLDFAHIRSWSHTLADNLADFQRILANMSKQRAHLQYDTDYSNRTDLDGTIR